MPADVVNLRRSRKAKAHDDKEKAAHANRLSFGRTKAEKTKQAAEHERAARAIDAHRRDRE